jgi:hypothetical protein
MSGHDKEDDIWFDAVEDFDDSMFQKTLLIRDPIWSQHPTSFPNNCYVVPPAIGMDAIPASVRFVVDLPRILVGEDGESCHSSSVRVACVQDNVVLTDSSDYTLQGTTVWVEVPAWQLNVGLLFVIIMRRDSSHRRHIPILASVPVPILPDAIAAREVENMLDSMLSEMCVGVEHTSDLTSWIYSKSKKELNDQVHHPTAGVLFASPKLKLFSYPRHVLYITYTLRFSPVCADLGTVLDATRNPSVLSDDYLKEATIGVIDSLIRVFQVRGMPQCRTLLKRARKYVTEQRRKAVSHYDLRLETVWE